MPNALHKALQTYFSRARRTVPPSPDNPSPTTTASSGSSNASWLFSACRFPKTPSFALDRTADPADGVHHFNTLYVTDDSDHPPEFTSNSGSQSSGFSTDSVSVDISLDLASAVASERFFIVPGTSNSILEDCTGETPAKKVSSETKTALVADGIAVTTFSPDPFVDFRQSMQEMVEARAQERAVDWEYLEELFFCYMKLNHPHDHKFILAAFADLLESLGVSREVGDLTAACKTGVICDAVTGATAVNGRRRRKGHIQGEKSDGRTVGGLRTGKSLVS
ncbi:transcription repressor OFP16-like [Nymphaea colorata]|uniref:transcription repressor OFP16-like n=1 Tax=Nymphaea colorata TaxID=210225 RepID=UPI00129E94F4|nr:transcription repressor OFP16-like [Nymphaea colorata]